MSIISDNNLWDYDKMFEKDIDYNFFYNAPGYRGNKLVVGVISLENAKKRLEKNEYYLLVKYKRGDEIPEDYAKNVGEAADGTLFASVHPKINLDDICVKGGIQRISSLDHQNYLIGPGPDTFNIVDLVLKKIDEYDEKYVKENIQENTK